MTKVLRPKWPRLVVGLLFNTSPKTSDLTGLQLSHGRLLAVPCWLKNWVFPWAKTWWTGKKRGNKSTSAVSPVKSVWLSAGKACIQWNTANVYLNPEWIPMCSLWQKSDHLDLAQNKINVYLLYICLQVANVALRHALSTVQYKGLQRLSQQSRGTTTNHKHAVSHMISLAIEQQPWGTLHACGWCMDGWFGKVTWTAGVFRWTRLHTHKCFLENFHGPLECPGICGIILTKFSFWCSMNSAFDRFWLRGNYCVCTVSNDKLI